MVSNNKVLTVSYGTFSCTLEGFDDSFDTMKAIAEYFRDLAADDRYFGAEPPTPDAEMLARIAEREIARRVDARMDRDRIVLRAAAAAAPVSTDATQTMAVASDDLTEVVAVAEAQPAGRAAAAGQMTDLAAGTDLSFILAAQADDGFDPAEMAAAAVGGMGNVTPVATGVAPPEAAPAAIAAPVMPTHQPDAVGAGSVAAKLDRIRAVVARAPDAAPVVAMAPVMSDVGDTGLAPHPDTVSTGPEVDLAPLPVPVEQPEQAMPQTDRLDASDPDADLQGDRAHDGADDLSKAYAGVDATGLNTGLTTEADDLDSLQAGIAEDDISADPLLGDDADVTTDAAPHDDGHGAATPAEDAAVAMVDDDLDSILARLMSKTARRGETGSDSTTAAQTADALQMQAAPSADPQAAAGQGPAVLAVPPLRARVMKMKRADFHAAIASGQIAQTAEDAAAAVPHAPPASAPIFSALSPEDEADLARELAEVEAELGQSTGQGQIAYDALDDERAESIYGGLADDYDDAADADDAEVSLFHDDFVPPKQADTAQPVRSVAQDSDDDLDDDLSGDTETSFDPARRGEAGQRLAEANADRDVMRLMAKTISEMDEPESTHRRSAIAHLRAAVAATKAEKQEGGVLKPEPSADPYREDLASVVRPRRPVAEGGTTTRRPGDARPAPLKLIAEQRVDLQTPMSSASGSTGQGTGQPVTIRPRRISVADIAAAPRLTAPTVNAQHDSQPSVDPAEGFAEFAEQVGAQSLSEVLEAAASYLSFVEGQEAFSRPQLMTKVRLLGGEDYSREDGLRSFGMLLRDGKIEKLKGGRFTVSDRIGFRPDTRAAG